MTVMIVWSRATRITKSVCRNRQQSAEHLRNKNKCTCLASVHVVMLCKSECLKEEINLTTVVQQLSEALDSIHTSFYNCLFCPEYISEPKA